jgi:hypothetical protein
MLWFGKKKNPRVLKIVLKDYELGMLEELSGHMEMSKEEVVKELILEKMATYAK